MSVFIEQKFIESLPEDPFDAILVIVGVFRDVMSAVMELPGPWAYTQRRQYEIAREVCALLSTYFKREGLALLPPPTQLTRRSEEEATEEERRRAIGETVHFMSRLEGMVRAQRQTSLFAELEQTFNSAWGPKACCEFSQDELDSIEMLLRLLRALVLASRTAGAAHAARLTRRIDRLAAELRAKTYDLSLFWGFVAEMSLVFSAPSEDSRRVAKEMKRLIRIVWSAQARSLARPPDTPFRLLGQEP